MIKSAKKTSAISALSALNSSGAKKRNEAKMAACFDVAKIHPDPNQPRKTFCPDAHAELTESIKILGLIQPIVIKKHPELPDSYLIVAGERRWRAHKELGKTQIDAIVRDYSTKDQLLVQLAENQNREALDPFEFVAQLEVLKTEYGVTQFEAGTALGLSKARTSELVRAAKAPAEISHLLREGVAVRAVVNLARAYDKDADFTLDQLVSAKEDRKIIDMKFTSWILEMIEKMDDEEPQSAPGEGEEPQSAPGEGEEPRSAPGEGEEPQSAPGEGEEPQSAPGEGEEPQSAPGEGEEPQKSPGFDDGGNLGEFEGFTKRSASKAEISVNVKGKGNGAICLNLAPKEPGQVIVEFSDGSLLAVEITDCQVVGYA